MELKINPDFKSLIPPLTPEEYRQLEENIIKEGCRDPLVIWNNTIIDGHNRYEICQKNNVSFKFTALEFEGEDAVKVWMIDNQKGRRNLTDGWKWELAQIRKSILVDKGKENLKTNIGEGQRLSTIDKGKEHNTQKEIAKELGWSTGKVAMADKVWKEAKPEIKEQVKSGDKTINQAYQEIKKEQKRKNFETRNQDFNKQISLKNNLETKVFIGDCLNILKNKKLPMFDLLLSDPPYAMNFKSGWNDWDKIYGDKRDETVNLLDSAFGLCKSILKDDAHIYIFGNPNEIQVVKPIFEKYFKLKNILIWDRKVIGMGDLKTYGRSYDVIYFGYNVKYKELNGTRDRDILSFNRVSPSDLKHPTEKPIDLLEYIIKKSTNENDFILDPFAGSCTTMIAAEKINRNSYGVELEQKYVKNEHR